MKPLLLTLALAAVSLATDTKVLVTEHGKTYHSKPTCMTLAHSSKRYETTVAIAVAHGMRPCGVCNRPAADPAKKKTSNGDWAKGGK